MRLYIYKGLVIAQSCLTLCDPMDCWPPGCTVHGILQARIVEWIAIPFSRGSSWPRDQTWVSCVAGRFFTVWATRETGVYMCVKTTVWGNSKMIVEITQLLTGHSMWRDKQEWKPGWSADIMSASRGERVPDFQIWRECPHWVIAQSSPTWGKVTLSSDGWSILMLNRARPQAHLADGA